MGTLTFPFTLTAGQPENVNQLNSNLAAIQTVLNGQVDAINLGSNSVTTVKITDANVTTAKIADANVTAAKIEAQQAWQTIAFATGTWSPTTVSYMKDSLGFVHLRGDRCIHSSGGSISAGTTLFTLPAGYRPVSTQEWPVTIGVTGVPAQITSGGVFSMVSSALVDGQNLALGAVTFRAEN